MKSPDTRFYVPDLAKGIVQLSEEESAHAVRVCRAQPGDILLMTDGAGHLAKGVVERADIRACTVNVESVEGVSSPKPLLHLGIACLKDDANEEVSLHVGEMDVASITLLRTERSEEPKNSDLKKVVRRCELKSLVSLKQSLKAWMTKIRGPVPFAEWLKDYRGDIILCDIDGERDLPAPTRETTLLVGPEGGFSPAEIEQIKSYKSGSVSLLKLGRTRLRARTAAIVGCGKMVP